MSDVYVVPLPPSPGMRDSDGGRRVARIQLYLRNGLTAIFALYLVGQVFGLASFDPMMLSGSAITIAGLWLAGGARDRMHAAIDQLRQNGALLLTPAQLGELHRMLDATGARFARTGAIITALAEVGVVVSGPILVPWLAHGRRPIRASSDGLELGVLDAGVFGGLLAVAVFAAAGVGWYLGQFAGYGRLPSLIGDAGGKLKGNAFAADKVGGLGPLVEFVWRQATLSLLPLLWIGSWLVLTAFESFAARYGFWRFPLILLFTLSILFAVQGLWAPARVLQRLFEQQIDNAGNDVRLAVAIYAARQKAGPATLMFKIVMAGLLLAIAAAGLYAGSRGGWQLALLGPPP